ncbi:MAG: hypothetical protein IJU91_10765 [Selenomonadaceae bacterium]|nr:hypothetical protein [Selenomonadaceae bacterium]
MSKSDASSTYATKTEQRNYIRSIMTVEDRLQFLDGNGNIVCEMYFSGNSGDTETVTEPEVSSIFDETYQDTEDTAGIETSDIDKILNDSYENTGETSGISESDIAEIFNGDDEITDADIQNLFED